MTELEDKETRLKRLDAFLLSQKPQEFTDESFYYATSIFMSVALNKTYELIQKENINQKTAEDMAYEFGNELRELCKKYTNIDLHEVTKKLINKK
jgi:hypothetical protein